MKIAVVCPYSIDEPGGVQQQAVGLVDGIRAAGHQAWLVAPGTTGAPDARLTGRPVRVRANGSWHLSRCIPGRLHVLVEPFETPMWSMFMSR